MNYQAMNRRVAAIGLIVAAQAVVGAGCAAKSHSDKSDTSHSTQMSAPAPAPASQPKPTTRPAAARTGTLYDRLGGDEVIRKVVDDFVARAVADPAVNFTRQGHPTPWAPTSENVQRLKQHLVQYIATAGDGPTKYQYWGRNMVSAHRGMGITGAEFDALAAHLAAALEANGVPSREREELMSTVATTRAAVVEVQEQPVASAPVDEVAPAPAEPTPEAGSPVPDAATPAPDATTPAPAETAPDGAAPVTVPSDDAQRDNATPAEVTTEEPKDTADSQEYKQDSKADEPAATATTSDEAPGSADEDPQA